MLLGSTQMNQLKTVTLLGLLSGLLILISYGLIGGTTGAVFGMGLALIMNLGSWYFSDQIALSVYRAQPVRENQAPGLYRIVKRLTQRANLPMPGIYIVPGPAANAFATGRDPQHAAVAVTEGILQLLPEAELEGVIAHELTHISNRDTLTQAVAATIAGAISFLVQMASYSLWLFGGNRGNDQGANPFGMLLAIFLAPLAATVLQLGISPHPRICCR